MAATPVETIFVVLRNNQSCQITNVTSIVETQGWSDKDDATVGTVPFFQGGTFRNIVDSSFLGRAVNAEEADITIVGGTPLFNRESPAAPTNLDIFAALDDNVTKTAPTSTGVKLTRTVFVRQNPTNGDPLTNRWFYTKDIKGLSDTAVV